MRLRHALLALTALVAACASAAGSSPPLFPALQQAEVEVVTQSGSHRFNVWIAADDRSREQGLMRVRELPPDHGMIFVFERPQFLAFWMKDTYLSLDLVFIAPDGKVLNIARHARPFSLDPIESDGPATAVLEVLAGTALNIALEPGDQIVLPTLQTTSLPSQRAPQAPADRVPD
jgi:uncharacterized protein